MIGGNPASCVRRQWRLESEPPHPRFQQPKSGRRFSERCVEKAGHSATPDPEACVPTCPQVTRKNASFARTNWMPRRFVGVMLADVRGACFGRWPSSVSSCGVGESPPQLGFREPLKQTTGTQMKTLINALGFIFVPAMSDRADCYGKNYRRPSMLCRSARHALVNSCHGSVAPQSC